MKIRVVVFIILFPIVVFLLIYLSNEQTYKQNFHGVIEGINFDIHNNPVVKLNLIENPISLLHFSFDNSPNSLMIGDSLNKKKGNVTLFHYRKNNDGIYFLYNKYPPDGAQMSER